MKTKILILLISFIFFFAAPTIVCGATNVYYSVGQNTTSHETGAGTVTVSGTTATFSVAQTATNMGVGDVVDYDSDNKKCYISGKTSTTVWSCVSATGGTPTAATNVTVNSISHAYASLSAAEAGATDANHLNTSNLVTGNYILNFPCYYDSGADTTAVTIGDYTTDSTHYLNIYTPTDIVTECNQNQRHSGTFDTSKYYMQLSNSKIIVITTTYDVRIDGLQFYLDSTNAVGQEVISYRPFANNGVDFRFSNNIIRGIGSLGAYGYHVGISMRNGGNTDVVRIWNNIIYDFIGGSTSMGIYIDLDESGGGGADVYAYNNTIHNARDGFKTEINYETTAINNVVQDVVAGSCYVTSAGLFNTASSNNVSDDGTQPGSNGVSGEVTFANEGSDDFHLSSSDTVARNAGKDVSSDVNLAFSNDVDGQRRPIAASWDVGADEDGVTQVYYSVGQSSSDLKTGSPTIGITNGVATFSTAQTGNIGVGDRITYSGGIVYISGKTSTTVWDVVTNAGLVPGDVASGTSVTSITHEYTSLSGAEAGATDSTHLNTSDLTTVRGYVLNFPCYYDSGADTTAATVDGYTTNSSDYIKIYTPNNTSTEANTSQRHSGVWSTSKYYLAPATGIVLTISDENVRMEGLQVNSTDNNGIYVNGATGASDVRVSQSIIKGNSTASKYGINLASTGSSSNARIWNNIVYDYSGASAAAAYWNDADWTIYIYSNTIQNSAIGLSRGNDTAHYTKNNLIHATDAFSGTFTDNDTNNDYNSISENNADVAIGSNGKYNQTYYFSDADGDDFHLSLRDSGAINSGVVLSSDANLAFSTDIDGDQRVSTTGKWDIGADENSSAVIQIKRNVNFGRSVNLH